MSNKTLQNKIDLLKRAWHLRGGEHDPTPSWAFIVPDSMYSNIYLWCLEIENQLWEETMQYEEYMNDLRREEQMRMEWNALYGREY
jgi:hypothetical protein